MNKHRDKGVAARAILAALAAAVAMGSLVGTAAPASADHTVCKRNYRFVPKVLVAEDIEDWWPDNTDEIQLTYPGQDYRTSIKQYERRYPPASPILAQLPGSTFSVSLYEWDGSSRRLLGRKSVAWTGTGDTLLHFWASGDFSYALTYKVEDLGATTDCVQYVSVPNMEWHHEDYARSVLDDNFTVVTEYVDDCLDPEIVRRQNPDGGELPRWSKVTIWVGACSSGYPL